MRSNPAVVAASITSARISLRSKSVNPSISPSRLDQSYSIPYETTFVGVEAMAPCGTTDKANNVAKRTTETVRCDCFMCATELHYIIKVSPTMFIQYIRLLIEILFLSKVIANAVNHSLFLLMKPDNRKHLHAHRQLGQAM